MSYGYIPNQFANGDAVTLFLVHLDIQVAPEPGTISRKKVYPYRSIALSQIRSALPHRVNLDKHLVACVVYSRSHAFHGGNQTPKENPTHQESNPRLSQPQGNTGYICML